MANGRRIVQGILDRWFQYPPIDLLASSVLAGAVGALYVRSDVLNAPGFAAPAELPDVFKQLAVVVGLVLGGSFTMYVTVLKSDLPDGPRSIFVEHGASKSIQRLILVSLSMVLACLLVLVGMSLPASMPTWTFLVGCVAVAVSVAALGRIVWLSYELRRIATDDKLERLARERRQNTSMPAPRARA